MSHWITQGQGPKPEAPHVASVQPAPSLQSPFHFPAEPPYQATGPMA